MPLRWRILIDRHTVRIQSVRSGRHVGTRLDASECMPNGAHRLLPIAYHGLLVLTSPAVEHNVRCHARTESPPPTSSTRRAPSLVRICAPLVCTRCGRKEDGRCGSPRGRVAPPEIEVSERSLGISTAAAFQPAESLQRRITGCLALWLWSPSRGDSGTSVRW